MSSAATSVCIHFENSNGNERESKTNLLFPLVLPRLTDDAAFFEFCQQNAALRIERSPTGETEVMAPSGAETGYTNLQISTEVELWNRQNGNPGYTFDSSAGFRLPSGAIRSPDASWIRRERWEGLTQDERERFAPLCPDFVIELLSPSDSLNVAQTKMQEYLDAGTRLGWLIDRKNRQVYIYRPGQSPQTLNAPTTVSGDPEMPGLQLPTARIF